jgi:predicted protein tyrosine phosphatase
MAEAIEMALENTWNEVSRRRVLPAHNKFDLVYGPNLYVGDREAVARKEWRAVVSAVSQGEYDEFVLPHLGKAETVHILVKDRDDVEIAPFFPTTRDFISNYITEGPVLVHCSAGMSRSATIACNYMMFDNPFLRLSVQNALLYLQAARPIIMPNRGFIQQLIDDGERIHKQYADAAADARAARGDAGEQ